jgi:hypothetical protein
MKLSTRIFVLSSALLASAASAQIVPLSARVSPLLPTILPAPALPIPAIIGGTRLPSRAPALTPMLILSAPLAAPTALAVAAAPAVASPVAAVTLAAASIDLSSRGRATPENRSDARRENVRHPLRGLPDQTVRFAGRGDEKDQESLDRIFDRGETDSDGSGLRRAPVDSSRRIGLPEQDLERELGL